MDERIAAAAALLPGYLRQHVLLSASALGLGLAISLPLVVAASRSPRLRWPVLGFASLVQTIPSLALLALFYPLLLGLSSLTRHWFGYGFAALGFVPALLALTLYSMLPILRNGVAGLTGVDPAVLEAARGVGMTARQRLLRVELPLAMPVLMAGIRTSAVWVIGAATLSTTVGQTSLGNYIFSGLQVENWVLVLFGCAAAALLALLTDQLLGLIEFGLARRKPRLSLAALGVLMAGVAAAAVPLGHATTRPYVIGAKDFSEQYILAQVMTQRLRRDGATVKRRIGLGSAVIFQALAHSEIDAYVDYSGTLWADVLHHRRLLPRAAMVQALRRQLRARYGIVVLGPLGFQNAYALAMRQKEAAALHIRTIADLARHAPELRIGGDLEFFARPEWAALQDRYGLHFKGRREYQPTFMYRALASGAVDVISAFTSDGRIAAQHLRLLRDPLHVIPPYEAVLLIAPRRASDLFLRRSLAPLVGAIPLQLMQRANYMVDRTHDKRSVMAAARWLAHAADLNSRAVQPAPGPAVPAPNPRSTVPPGAAN